jgi:type II secretory pathway component PulF
MAVFTYRAAVAATGKTIDGIVEAPSAEAAATLLGEKDLVVISITEARGNAADALTGGGLFKHRVGVRDVVIFTRQLSVLSSANLPLVQALKILVNQLSNPRLQAVVAEIAGEVEGGMKLSRALARHPKLFSDFYVNIVRSGETSGKLDEILNYLADQLEKDYDLNSKIRGAMIYPTFILGGLFVVATLMMAFVIPQLTKILVEANIQLPLSTRILIFLSRAVRGYWWLGIIIIAGSYFGIRRYLATLGGQARWGYIQLRMPIFGPLLQRIYLVRFSRSLSTLLIGGVPLTSALEIVADVVGNASYKQLIQETVKAVEDGNPIASIMQKRPDVVPPMVTHMLSVGEQTGRIDAVLGRISDFYTREVNNIVLNLSTIIEPIIMIILGAGVAALVMAIMLPMYQLSNAVG